MTVNHLSKQIESPKVTLPRLAVLCLLAMAFAYIESAVVVYLRAIFHPEGFIFPLTDFGLYRQGRNYLAIEAGRGAATLVLIICSCWIFGHNRRQRLAGFFITFAVWDIFYYFWLKVLIGWPGSLVDWDILFLMPMVWAGPVIAPVIASVAMLGFGAAILYLDNRERPLKIKPTEWAGLISAALLIVVSFCITGLGITEANYRQYFSWPLFLTGQILTAVIFLKCLISSKAAPRQKTATTGNTDSRPG